MAKLSLATSIDPIDARVSLGSMVKSPTDVTALLIEIGGQVRDKKFDLIEPKLGEIERLYPDFPGSIAVRLEVAPARGCLDEAEKFAQQLTAILPNDPRVASAHLFIAERCLARKEPAQAEKRVLAAIALDPANEELKKKFETIFGYRPSAK
jgi:tetratricopeptide (TPR) repeat protein